MPKNVIRVERAYFIEEINSKTGRYYIKINRKLMVQYILPMGEPKDKIVTCRVTNRTYQVHTIRFEGYDIVDQYKFGKKHFKLIKKNNFYYFVDSNFTRRIY